MKFAFVRIEGTEAGLTQTDSVATTNERKIIDSSTMGTGVGDSARWTSSLSQHHVSSPEIREQCDGASWAMCARSADGATTTPC